MVSTDAPINRLWGFPYFGLIIRGLLVIPHAIVAFIIGIVAFILVMQSKVATLSFIPGAFCGAAVTAWASPSDARGYLMVALALLVGAVLGYVSEWAGGMMAKKRA